MSSLVPDGWSFTDFGQISSNRKTKFQPEIDSERFVYLGLEHLGVASRKIRDFGSSVDVMSTKTKFYKGDTLFGKLRPYLRKVAYPDFDGICSTDILALSPCKNTDAEFLFYICSSDEFIANAVESSAGNIMPRASWGDLVGFPILYPPLPEQKKIASILTSVDEVIENTQKQIDKLQDLKKATMNELLTKGIGHTEFKDSELGRIPKSWEVTKFGKVTERFYQGINTVADKVVYHSTGIPILQTKHITSGEITFAAIKYLDEETYLRYKDKFQPRHNDILLSNIGTIGKSVLVQKPSEYLIAWNIFLISVTSELEPRFAHLHLQKLDIENYYENLMTGNATKFVNKSNLSDILLTLPSIAEQVEISNILDAIVSKIELQKQKLSQTQSLKKSLMQDLLTGKVRVTVN